jgi:hypothetical protein
MARRTSGKSDADGGRPLVLLWSEPGRRGGPHMRITTAGDLYPGGWEGVYTN